MRGAYCATVCTQSIAVLRACRPAQHRQQITPALLRKTPFPDPDQDCRPGCSFRTGWHAAMASQVCRRASGAVAETSFSPVAAVQPEFVQLAHRLADAAAEVTRPYFRSKIMVETKADTSPVTEADRRAEAAMRALIHEVFPDHAVFGEEEGLQSGEGSPGSSAYLWVLDPIDGTKSFITGKPMFGTLIALLHEGEPVLGIIDQPILRERWLGVEGQATTLNGKSISTRQIGDISAAYLYCTTPHMFEGVSEAAFARVRDAVNIPLYGCDCYAYGLLAAGFCDLVVEADMKPYDYMALVPIVQGAGGVITDWTGQPLHWPLTASHAYALDALPGEVIAAGDPVVHAEAISLLAWGTQKGSDTSSVDMY